MKMTEGLEHLTCMEQLRELELFRLDKRSFREILSIPEGRVQRRWRQALFSGPH